MVNILVLVGKSASGKDYIRSKIIEKYRFEPLIAYTTRPMREYEKQDETYHFISEEEFKHKIDENFFAEWNVYESIHGKWYYGTALADYYKDESIRTVAILAPRSLNELKEKGINVFSTYIYSSTTSRYKRLSRRGDDFMEAKRRIKADDSDFEGIESKVDYIARNHFGDDIKYVMEDIMDAYDSYLLRTLD